MSIPEQIGWGPREKLYAYINRQFERMVGLAGVMASGSLLPPTPPTPSTTTTTTSSTSTTTSTTSTTTTTTSSTTTTTTTSAAQENGMDNAEFGEPFVRFNGGLDEDTMDYAEFGEPFVF